jgi:hypothetical protein
MIQVQEKVTMSRWNQKRSTLTQLLSREIETYTLKHPAEDHARILYGFTEGLIKTRDQYLAKKISTQAKNEVLTIELDKVTYVNQAEKEALIQKLDTLAKQRDEAILNLDNALGKRKSDTMKINSSLD